MPSQKKSQPKISLEKRALKTFKTLSQLREDQQYHAVDQCINNFKKEPFSKLLEGQTLFTWAILNHKNSFAVQLLENQPNFIKTNNQKGDCALNCAIRVQNIPMIKRLLSECDLKTYTGDECLLFTKALFERSEHDQNITLAQKEQVHQCGLLLIEHLNFDLHHLQFFILKAAHHHYEDLLKASLDQVLKIKDIQDDKIFIKLLWDIGKFSVDKSVQEEITEKISSRLNRQEGLCNENFEERKNLIHKVLTLTVGLSKRNLDETKTLDSLYSQMLKAMSFSADKKQEEQEKRVQSEQENNTDLKIDKLSQDQTLVESNSEDEKEKVIKDSDLNCLHQPITASSKMIFTTGQMELEKQRDEKSSANKLDKCNDTLENRIDEKLFSAQNHYYSYQEKRAEDSQQERIKASEQQSSLLKEKPPTPPPMVFNPILENYVMVDRVSTDEKNDPRNDHGFILV